MKSGALGGEKNLVYTAPTGGGKSLIADILMLKKVIETPGKKALLVLPYVALVQEKMRWLRKVVEGITKTSATSLLLSNDQHSGGSVGTKNPLELWVSSVAVGLKRRGKIWISRCAPD